MTSAAGKLCCIQRIEASVGREHETSSRSSRRQTRNFRPIIRLEHNPGKIGDDPAQRANPAFLGYHDRDRLALDQRLLDCRFVMLGRLGEARAALAERSRSGRISCAAALISSATLLHCSFSEPSRSLSLLRSERSSLSSFLISISSSLRKLRSRIFSIASACTSESLNVFIRTGLGSSSLRMILITLSRFR